MKTTVMFVDESVPLAGTKVRLGDGGGEDVLLTDDEGRIQVEVELGENTFHIEHDGEWIERTVNRQGEAALFVVNIQQSDAHNIQTLNTLQIDLANLVGDRYVFETVLGRGGMGVVVKAIDRMLNRPVAIKLLSDELRENEEAQQIFLVEARNLATLSHPNLVAIHDILNVGGRVLMVFEYVLGENVEKTIKRDGAIGQLDVLRIGIQLARCVAYLHEHDLIHRDLKPANIIMQGDGQLKLVDFGLARSLNELYIRGTRVRGTPAYMAPEQIKGVHLTTATDLYQIGISLYEMLAGKLPFPTGDMAYAHVHLDPPPLTEAVPGIDPELASLVQRCLSKQPKERPSSALEFLEYLQSIYARLATNESSSALLFDSGPLPATSSGEFVAAPSQPAAGQPPQPPQLPQPPKPPANAAMSQELYLEEFGDESNTALYVMAAVGAVALLVAGYLFLAGGESTDDPISDGTAGAAAVVNESPDNVPDDAPIEEGGPQDVESAIVAGRGVLTVAFDAASDDVGGLAAVDVPAPPVQPARVERSNATTAPPPKKTEPVAQPKPKPATKDKIKPPAEPVAREPNPPALLGSEEKGSSEPKNELLSVDDEGSNSLLPVTE